MRSCDIPHDFVSRECRFLRQNYGLATFLATWCREHVKRPKKRIESRQYSREMS